MNEVTWQPWGLMPDMTCLIVPSLPGGVHGLEDEEDAPLVLGVELVLHRGEPLDPLLQVLLRLGLGEARGCRGCSIRLRRNPFPSVTR